MSKNERNQTTGEQMKPTDSSTLLREAVLLSQYLYETTDQPFEEWLKRYRPVPTNPATHEQNGTPL